MSDLELIQRCADKLNLQYFAQSWSGGIMHYVGAAGNADVRDFNPLKFPDQAKELDTEGIFGDMKNAFSRRMVVRSVVLQ